MPRKSNNVRLRGKNERSQTWEVGSVPNHVIEKIGAGIACKKAVGCKDITGDDVSSIFADAIGGTDLSSPLGVVDVVHDKNIWSVKTVKASKPFEATTVRLISGRNSVDYSFGINDPRANVQKTGEAVVSIWNCRIDEAIDKYRKALRLLVLVRNFDKSEFLLFESTNSKFVPRDFKWETNGRGNLQGHDKVSKKHLFTWQPHGAQFTIIRPVPGSAVKFKIGSAGELKQKQILKAIGFVKSDVQIIES